MSFHPRKEKMRAEIATGNLSHPKGNKDTKTLNIPLRELDMAVASLINKNVIFRFQYKVEQKYATSTIRIACLRHSATFFAEWLQQCSKAMPQSEK